MGTDINTPEGSGAKLLPGWGYHSRRGADLGRQGAHLLLGAAAHTAVAHEIQRAAGEIDRRTGGDTVVIVVVRGAAVIQSQGGPAEDGKLRAAGGVFTVPLAPARLKVPPVTVVPPS